MYERDKRVAFVGLAIVLLYGAATLYRVVKYRDFGFECLTNSERGDIRPAIVRWVEPADEPLEGPVNGDQLWTVAGVEVPTLFHLAYQVAAIDPTRGAVPAVQAASVAELAALPPDTMLADIDGTRWARIEYLRAADGPTGDLRTCWLPMRPVARWTVVSSVAWFLLQMSIVGIGALVVWKRPGDGSAVTFFLLCAVNATASVGGFHWRSLIASPWLFYMLIVSSGMLVPVTLHFYLLFPRPLGLIRRWPRATWVLLYSLPTLILTSLVWNLFNADWLLQNVALQQGSALDVLPLLDATDTLAKWSLAFSLTAFVVGQGVLIHSYLNCRTTAERNQVKWLLGAVLLATLPIGYLLYMAMTDRAEFQLGSWSGAILYGTSLLCSLAYVVSITRYKLLHVGRLVNRGILYVGISFAATALFCLMVALATTLLGTYVFQWQNALAAGLTTMLVVVFLGWVRDRIQRALDRRFHREKHRLDRALRLLGEAVDQLVEPSILARQLVQAARDVVGAERGAVYLLDRQNIQLELAHRVNWPHLPDSIATDSPLVPGLVTLSGDVDRTTQSPASIEGQQQLQSLGGALSCALERDGAVVGLLLLGEKEDGTLFTTEDRNFLVALARTTALALRSAQGHRTIDSLKTELQDKVQKIAEQQRRILYLQGELLSRNDGGGDEDSGDLPRLGPLDTLKHEIRGSSPVVRDMLLHVAKIALSPSSVLIRGESGTGKELLARAIHFNSPRSEKPFVQVHCAALSAGLLESELFGHVKGAFTGADRDKAGRFELANNGTLFLDEIGDINLETQTKLLRALQEKAFERVGGVKTISVDVRLIAATHQNLEELIRQGRFREDLYYRLNVISLLSPPLRARREDIFELALHFLRMYSTRAGKPIVRIDEEALEVLAAYPWPGNIRQLENAIERAVVLADHNSIGLADLPPEILAAEQPMPPRLRAPRLVLTRGDLIQPPEALMPLTVAGPSIPSLTDEVQDVERERLLSAIAHSGGNKAQAARLLGIPRSTLFSKLRKHGLE
jgi:transcriptional regulator with GAF, ATPase, and Fis domain